MNAAYFGLFGVLAIGTQYLGDQMTLLSRGPAPLDDEPLNMVRARYTLLEFISSLRGGRSLKQPAGGCRLLPKSRSLRRKQLGFLLRSLI